MTRWTPGIGAAKQHAYYLEGRAGNKCEKCGALIHPRAKRLCKECHRNRGRKT